MEAVADLQLLELAQVIVELGQGRILAFAVADTAVAVEPDAAAQFEDRAREIAQAARVHAGRVVILVDELLELGERPVGLGARQGRGQMVDDHRLRAPLGLAALAGVVDDEGIEVRERAEGDLGEAFGGECQRLPRQPFEIAVLAHVDDGVDVERGPEPGIEGEVAVRRDEGCVVIGFERIDVVAARGLDADDDVAKRECCQAEGIALDEGVARGLAPTLAHGKLHGLRQPR